MHPIYGGYGVQNVQPQAPEVQVLSFEQCHSHKDFFIQQMAAAFPRAEHLGALYTHLCKRPDVEFQTVLDGRYDLSRSLRDFIGIRNEEHDAYWSCGCRIAKALEPMALAMAAVYTRKGERAERALTKLDAVLAKRFREGGSNDSEFMRTVTGVMETLAQNSKRIDNVKLRTFAESIAERCRLNLAQSKPPASSSPHRMEVGLREEFNRQRAQGALVPRAALRQAMPPQTDFSALLDGRLPDSTFQIWGRPAPFAGSFLPPPPQVALTLSSQVSQAYAQLMYGRGQVQPGPSQEALHPGLFLSAAYAPHRPPQHVFQTPVPPAPPLAQTSTHFQASTVTHPAALTPGAGRFPLGGFHQAPMSQTDGRPAWLAPPPEPVAYVPHQSSNTTFDRAGWNALRGAQEQGAAMLGVHAHAGAGGTPTRQHGRKEQPPPLPLRRREQPPPPPPRRVVSPSTLAHLGDQPSNAPPLSSPLAQGRRSPTPNTWRTATALRKEYYAQQIPQPMSSASPGPASPTHVADQHVPPSPPQGNAVESDQDFVERVSEAIIDAWENDKAKFKTFRTELTTCINKKDGQEFKNGDEFNQRFSEDGEFRGSVTEFNLKFSKDIGATIDANSIKQFLGLVRTYL